jgi:alpha-tubulin suppressor-like RCC1 family protein
MLEGLPLGTEIEKVYAGANHTIMQADDDIFACGDNQFGQCGLGRHGPKCTPLLKCIPEFTAVTIKKIVCTRTSTLVLKKAGTAFAFGSNIFGTVQYALTMHSQCTHYAPTMHSLCTI